jgi:hypothetical protein
MTSKIEMYKTYLDQEGFHPSQDGGLLIFKQEGRTYVITADENDLPYFQIVFPNFWSIDSDQERAKAYQAANHATSATKVAKIYVREDGKNMWGSIEMFFESPEQFKGVFVRALSALMAGVANFTEKMK